MLFNTAAFACFFIVFFGLYRLLPLTKDPKLLLLLVGSFFFYASWDYRFIPLLLGTGYPIIRSSRFLPQLERLAPIPWISVRRGFFLIGAGLFKKTVADLLAPVADRAFSSHGPLSALDAWTSALAFTGQIYGDFSGYTDIAIGSAALLGFHIPDNFNLPYLSTSPVDFWKRWHISLSSWLRDYLYISLGGNRSHRSRNLMLTMLLGGLWYGVGFPFIVWGFYHGALLVGTHLLIRRFPALDRKLDASTLGRTGKIAVTFYLTLLGWILFRADDLRSALRIGMAMHRPEVPSVIDRAALTTLLLTAAAIVVCHLVDHFGHTRRDAPPSPAAEDSSPLGTLAAGLLGLAVSLGLVRAAAAIAVSVDALAFGPTHPRIQQVIELLPVLAQKRRPAAVAIGSSQLWNGFAPEIVDAELARAGKSITSYNLGFDGLGPSTAERMLARLHAAYAATGERPALLILEFTPFLATRKARLTGFSDEPNMQLGTEASFAEEAKFDLGKALGAMASHYLLGGLSASRFKSFIEGKIYGEFSPCGLTPVTGSKAAQAATDALCRDLMKVFPEGLPAWSDDDRGFRRLVYRETIESYKGMVGHWMRDPDLLFRDFERQNKAVDLVELDFDPELVAEFIRAVLQAKALSPRVFVFSSPVNPAWVKRSTEGKERFLKTAARIERETGIEVVDWTEDPAFEPDDFIDTTHLNQLTGAQKFSKMIASRLKELL
jgi:D-alanyl-lipoteichoic acid acyltransferase DltB (MBOAT superfamily)